MTTGRNISLISVLMALIFAGPLAGQAAAADNKTVRLSETQTITVLIYNFMKYSQWANESDIQEFTLGIYGGDGTLYRELKNVSSELSVRGKPVKPVIFYDIKKARNAHVLVIDKSKNEQLDKIASRILKTDTLMITNGAVDKKIIMINFIYTSDKRLGYEVNKSNMLYEGITPSNEILLYGGTEIDIATLYKEMELSLREMKDRVNLQKMEIETKNNQLQTKTRELDIRMKKIDQASKTLNEKNKILQKTILKTKGIEEELKSSKDILTQSKQRLASRESEILSLEKNIKNNQSTLEQQTAELELRKEEILTINEKVEEQGSIIVSQRKYLYGGATMFALAITLILSLFVSFRQKQRFASERKIFEAEASLVKAQAKAIDAYESNLVLKNEFLASISHELRTPMNGIMGWIQLQKKRGNQELLKTIDIISDSASEMMCLVNDILTYTEIHSGQIKIHPESLEMADTLEKLRHRYKIMCDSKQLNLHWEVDPKIPHWLEMDRTKFLTILSKLLDNAVKFTDKGTIEFKANINTDDSPSTLICTVRDSGIGIHKDDQLSIFEAFRQKETGLTRRFGGLGIGLAICQKLVSTLEGELSLESESNTGSTFIVSLPVKESQILSAALLKPDKKAIISDNPVLVVEDNMVNQKILQKMLTELGYDTLVANQGEEALTILDNKPVSLVLMDLQMPVMDGFTCTKKIRQRENTINEIPIVAVTANLMDADRERCMKAGMNGYLEKPINLELLRTTIAKFVLPGQLQTAG